MAHHSVPAAMAHLFVARHFLLFRLPIFLCQCWPKKKQASAACAGGLEHSLAQRLASRGAIYRAYPPTAGPIVWRVCWLGGGGLVAPAAAAAGRRRPGEGGRGVWVWVRLRWARGRQLTPDQYVVTSML